MPMLPASAARLALTAALYLGYGPALATPVTCPPVVEPGPPSLTTLPEGWSGFVDTVNARYNLMGVQLYSGHPRELATLVPDTQTADSALWNLAADPRGYYFACEYSNTALNLIRQLPAEMKACIVTYEKGASNANGTPAIQFAGCE